MAQVIWTEPALSDLDAIADYIAIDSPVAARKLVQNVFDHVDHLANHPQMGSKPPEIKGWRYRQMVEPPCRIFYRHEKDKDIVYILYVTRGERLFDPKVLPQRG
ncbi:type II toxin-antitoxin system RelE/ParE family toxin [Hydrocarboniphaga sp.]|uniref:type II toxin-antitoxin system RelE/ParE family toxin n=1 Tax=Hydrocarboniphaga sp. TaxID=2033016 RepID=UPI003D110C9D